MEKEDTLAITEAVTPEESFQVFQVFEVAENMRAKPGNKDPAWNEPIKKELETLKKHGVFEVVRDPGKRANKAPMVDDDAEPISDVTPAPVARGVTDRTRGEREREACWFCTAF